MFGLQPSKDNAMMLLALTNNVVFMNVASTSPVIGVDNAI